MTEDEVKKILKKNARKVVVLTYTKKGDKEPVIRYVHPYSIRDSKKNIFLCASESQHPEEIRRFSLESIEKIEVTAMPFTPKWKVEF